MTLPIIPVPAAGRVENIVGSLFDLEALKSLNVQYDAMNAEHTGLLFRA